MTTFDPEDSRPAYQRVAEQLMVAIRSRTLTPGDQLPTHKALAAEYGVAVETVKRAIADLRAAGLVVTKQGKGSYVRGVPDDEDGSAQGANNIIARVDELTRELERIKQRLEALEGALPDE